MIKPDNPQCESSPCEIVVTVGVPGGLHLRVGKEVVAVAARYRSTITARNLTRTSPAVDLKSILQLLQLQALQGHTLALVAQGEDAPAALTALQALLESSSPPDGDAP